MPSQTELAVNAWPGVRLEITSRLHLGYSSPLDSAVPPAASIRNAMGAASYRSRSLPGQ